MSVGPEIAQQRVRDTTHRFRPRLDSRNSVDANAQDLGIVPGKLGKIFLVSRHLNGSDWGEGERIERQNNVLLTLETGKCHISVQMRFQGEIRSFFANFRCIDIFGHGVSSCSFSNCSSEPLMKLSYHSDSDEDRTPWGKRTARARSATRFTRARRRSTDPERSGRHRLWPDAPRADGSFAERHFEHDRISPRGRL